MVSPSKSILWPHKKVGGPTEGQLGLSLQNSPLPHLDGPFPLTVWDLKFMTHPGGNVDRGDVIHEGVTHRLLWQEHETFDVVSRHPGAILHHAHIVLIPVLPEKKKTKTHTYCCTNELNVRLRWGHRINNRWWIRLSSFWLTAGWLLKMNLDIYPRVSADAWNKPLRKI